MSAFNMETSPLILMQPEITKKYNARVLHGVICLISETKAK